MRAAIVSDHDVMTGKARGALLRAGHDCPAGNVYRLADAVNRLSQARPELVLVCLSPDPERALAVVAQLRHLVAVPVFAIGPATDPQLILRTLRTGATDFVEETDLATELVAALRRLQSEQGTVGALAPREPSCCWLPAAAAARAPWPPTWATVLAKEHLQGTAAGPQVAGPARPSPPFSTSSPPTPSPTCAATPR